ncbi:MAG: sulfatase-like hydrolase/transferase [Bryobacterales bacterium]|nr:sulfatase-like hydrolase/transferase [Bryobacterales bacterium]
MRRRSVLKQFAGWMAAPAVLRAQRRPGDKPNLLFVWTDQQRPDTMAAYGNTTYKVPAMNRLAAESVVFERAYVTQPVCTPSRSSVLSGLWPHQNGCVNNNIRMRPETRTLPELLADSSYRTGYMGKWHLGDEVFAQHGFQEWRSIEDGYQRFFSPARDPSKRSSYHDFLLSQGYKPGQSGTFGREYAVSLPVEHTKPSYLATEASRFILENRAEPWLLHVNFLEPHSPFTSRLNDLHSREEAPVPQNCEQLTEGAPEPEWYGRHRKSSRESFKSFQLDTRAGWERVNRNYAGLCSLVDQAVGRILWALEASGQAENTIVVYTSDHGEMMGSHGMITKSVMYEESARVPLLMRVPFRGQRPMRVRRPVSHIDLVPSLLDLMGKPRAAEGLAGRSNVSLLNGRDDDAPVFLEWNAQGPGRQSNARTAVSPEGYKLVLHEGDHGMLFDLNRDPLEMTNRFGDPALRSVQTKLAGQIRGWQKTVNDTLTLRESA